VIGASVVGVASVMGEDSGELVESDPLHAAMVTAATTAALRRLLCTTYPHGVDRWCYATIVAAPLPDLSVPGVGRHR